MKNHGTSLYMVISNTILIGNLKGGYARIQTLAHECMHSIQNRKLLLFNYIFSNIYILYFFVITIFTVFNMVSNKMLQLFILTITGFIFYAVRSYLETDAMTKAKYLAKEYLENTEKCNSIEIEKLMNSYDEINKQAIPFTNYSLILKVLTKIIIYCIVCIISNF